MSSRSSRVKTTSSRQTPRKRTSPTRKSSPSRKSSPKKNCKREWIRNPITDRWIEVDGATWKKLYSTHKKQLDNAERKTTPGVMKKGVCTPPQGDPPHDRGYHRGHRRHSNRRYRSYDRPYYYDNGPYYYSRPGLTLNF